MFCLSDKSKAALPLLQRIISSFENGFADKKIAAAVSGGCDSVALLLILNELSKMRGFSLCVFHVDHSLRANSKQDRIWVQKLCSRLNLPFYYREAAEADKTDRASGHKTGSEAWARWFRYKSFAEMLKSSEASVIATAHTADDQAETVVMRLLRGCGAAGAIGIKSKITLKTDFGRLKMWRPLLSTSKADLKAYLKALNQGWREDETNGTEDYFRNRIRHSVLPILKKAANNVSAHISSFAKELAEMHSFLSFAAGRYIKKYGSAGYLQVKLVPKKALRQEVIRQWLVILGLGEKTNRAVIKSIDGLWLSKQGGKRVKIKNYEFLRRKKTIFISKIS